MKFKKKPEQFHGLRVSHCGKGLIIQRVPTITDTCKYTTTIINLNN